MKIVRAAHLDKQDSIPEMINHGLPASMLPPLDRQIKLTSSRNQPKRNAAFEEPLHLRRLIALLRAQMDVAFELGRSDLQPQMFVEKLNEPVQRMVRHLVRQLDERVIAFECFQSRLAGREMSQIRIVTP